MTRRPWDDSGSCAPPRRSLQQLRGELRQLAERAATLDPEHCPPERVCHIIT